MGLVMEQYSICLVNLEPTIGHEIKKTRPCVIISHINKIRAIKKLGKISPNKIAEVKSVINEMLVE